MRLRKQPREPKIRKSRPVNSDPGRLRSAITAINQHRLPFTWSNILKAAVVTTGVLIFLFMATLICTPNPTTEPQDPTPFAQEPLAEPISSTSSVQLTREEIDEKTAEYLALNLWAEVAHRTATNEPENFLPVIFSIPDVACVESYREILEARPAVYPEPVNRDQSTPEEYQEYLREIKTTQTTVQALQDEHLLGCTTQTIKATETRTWDDISGDEQEARARRAMRLLALSIDPPMLMSTNIASSRGVLVNSQNNPEFAKFASEYDTCQVQADGFAVPLAQTQTPQEMAQLWLQAYNHLKNCFNNITGIIFPDARQQPPPGAPPAP